MNFLFKLKHLRVVERLRCGTKPIARAVKANKWLAIFIGVFVLASLTTFAWVGYNNRLSINPDGVAYMSIAEYYAEGDFRNAINAYWSPLLSLLMAPLVKLGLTGQQAFTVVNFATVSIIFVGGGALVGRLLNWLFPAVLIYLLTVFPFMIMILLGEITPDALVVAWVLGYVPLLAFAFRRLDFTAGNISRNFKWLTMLAAYGFIGYLTKLYLLPVFIATVALLLTAKFFMSVRESGDLKPVLLGAVKATIGFAIVFSVISAVWVVPISIKYGEPMVGSSHKFNSGPKNLPMTRMMIPTFHDEAVTAWEDPTYLIPYKSINPPESKPVEKNVLLRTYYKLPAFMDKIGEMWIFMYMPIFTGLVFLVLARPKGQGYRVVAVSLLVWAVYFAGYARTVGLGNHRYQWPLLLISILIFSILAGIAWARVSRSYGKEGATRRLALLMVVLLIPTFVFWSQQLPRPYTLFERNPTPTLYVLAENIKSLGVIKPGDKIAGDSFSVATYMGYYLDTPSYGVFEPGKSINSETVINSLRSLGVDYVIVSEVRAFGFSSDYKVVYSHQWRDPADSKCMSMDAGDCLLYVLRVNQHVQEG